MKYPLLLALIALIAPSLPKAGPRQEAPTKPLTQTTMASVTNAESNAEPNVLLNDPAIARSWGLEMTEATEAWRISTGDRRVIVAVIDTGVDIEHPDLKENIWTNPGESGPDSQGRDKATNGIDDDGNGFIDDVHGWNFAMNNNDVRDNQGHGTHIAGIIGAVGGNEIGISGIAPKVTLLPIKYFDPKAKAADQIMTTIRSIRYAVQMGAKIINYSAGGRERNAIEEEAIKEAAKQGVLLVAAAGNEKSNSDISGYYPADYDLPNILSVTAVDSRKEVLPSSNYGTQTVDLAAPGLEILSTLPGGRYGHMTGTSQATAFASGVAALLLATRPDLQEPVVLIRYLVKTGDRSPTLRGLTKYQSLLNSYKALVIRDRNIAATGVSAENTTAMDQELFLSRTSDPASRREIQPK